MKKKKQVRSYFLYLFFTIWGINSCTIREDDPVVPSSQIVVEGYLFAHKPVSIRLMESSPFGLDSAIWVPNLQISLESSTGNKMVLSYSGKGEYVSKQTEKVEGAGTSYTLTFTYKGKEVKAITTIPEKPKQLKASSSKMIIPQEIIQGENENVIGIGSSTGGSKGPSLSLSWLNPESNYYSVKIVNTSVNPEQIRILPPGFLLDNLVGQIPPNQRNWMTLYSDQFYAYGRHALILLRLNTDYVALFDTENSTSLNLKTPPSLISNGLGIFTGVNSDTLYVDILKK